MTEYVSENLIHCEWEHHSNSMENIPSVNKQLTSNVSYASFYNSFPIYTG